MKKDAVKVVAAAVILLVAIGLVLARSRGGAAASVRQAYFYDLGSGELFAASAEATPPIAAPSGEANGVQAVVMACGDCSASGRRIVYLRSLTDEARPLAREHGISSPRVLAAGILVASPPQAGAAPVWVRMDSPEGERVTAAAGSLCPGAPATPCTPAND